MRLMSQLLLLTALALFVACGDSGDSTKPAENGGPAKPANEGGGTDVDPGPESGGTDIAGPAIIDMTADDVAREARETLAKGRDYLLAQVNDDGSIGKGLPFDGVKPASTVMAVLALIAATPSDQVRDDKVINAALDYLVKLQDDTGAIIEPTGKRNYVTAVFVSALAAARLPKYRKALVAAKDYLQTSQIADAQTDPSYGGFPYKQEQGQPADLSNAQYAFEALKNAERAGEKVDPVVWERARTLLARLQNRSEVNTVKFKRKIKVDGKELEAEVVSGNDNGATYYPGNSKAGYEKQADGSYVAKSYGSMTYALLKCLLFSGVTPDDPRVKGAVTWISQNWAVDHNPGFSGEDERMQGYFYYLHTASRALAEYERYTKQTLQVRDANGEKHNWRYEIMNQLKGIQADDGSWVNAKDRWDEGLPIIVTSYVVQTLAYVSGRMP